jgi:tetratricopeptide (TPR) repeat protein
MIVRRTAPAVAMVLAAFLSSAADAQDTLARVKALYIAAAYDEALALLNQVDRAASSDGPEVDQYRAFCLLALGRSDDARAVIQQIVEASPSFQPSETQASPRLQDAFRDVRRRVLPGIVRQTYSEAKAAFERKELELAARRFDTVISLLEDADLIASSELLDLRILATGFMDLIKTVPPTPVAAQPTPAAPAPESPRAPSIYGPDDPDVTPPVAISQAMPAWHPARQEVQIYEGRLLLDIDERGEVTSVVSQGSLQPGYALSLRRAARTWKFRPATKNGVPVKFRKVVVIHLNPMATQKPESS